MGGGTTLVGSGNQGDSSGNYLLVENANKTVSITVPNGAGAVVVGNLDLSTWGVDPATFNSHAYVTDDDVGAADQFTSQADVWATFLKEAMPRAECLNSTVVNGNNYVMNGGIVTSFVDTAHDIVSNVTTVNHVFGGAGTGAVVRELYLGTDGHYHIVTFGFGNGAFGGINSHFAPDIWAGNVEKINEDAPHTDLYPPGVQFATNLALLESWTCSHTLKPLQDFVASLTHYEPLVLNLTANSAPQTTSVWGGTQFDLQNNGFKQQTAWVGADSGILVYDPTGGAITNGSQLFGTSYSLSGGGYAVDGFAALADLDSNSDGIINSSDTHWSDLRVWVDGNGNGVVDSGELETMSAAGISSFSLTTTNTDTTDANGNYIGKTATYSLAGGGTREVADVSFETKPMFTVTDTAVALDGTVSLLPDVLGSGTVNSLLQAMQIEVNDSDTTLEGYVQAFVAATDDATRNTLVDEIIYEWTGVAGVSPTARGVYFDARKLESLEHFDGESYTDPFNSTSNPSLQSVPFLTAGYQQLHNQVLSELEMGSNLESLFNDIQSAYDSTNNIEYLDFSAAETEILNDLSANRASGLATLADFNESIRAQDTNPTGPFLGDYIDLNEGYSTFRNDLVAQGADVAATFLDGTPVVYGTAGNDVITAWAGNQTVIASQGGADVLIGGGDNETFYGSSGGDLIIGGTGTETFWGGNNDTPGYGGNADTPADTFIAGQGTESFYESDLGRVIAYYAAGDGNLTFANFVRLGDDNTLVLDSSIDRADVDITLSGINLTITDGTMGDQITILARTVSTLEFADGTTINLLTTGGTHATTGGTTLGTGAWDDIYQYNPGTGHVTLNDVDGANELWIGGTLTAANVSFSTSGNDLLITDGVVGDQIDDENFSVGTIRFSDGSTLSAYAAGNTYTLSGGTTSTGTGLNDTYSFASATGTATISDPGGLNTLKLGAGLTAASLTFTGSGNDLLITDGVAGDKIIIPGQLSSPVIKTIKFNDNSTLNLTAGLNLAEAAGQSLLNGTTGNDTLTGNSGSQTLNGNRGNDVYINGSGPTTINAGSGNDTYSYASGSGALTINDTGGADTIILGSGITTGNTSLIASGHDLLITDSVSGDTITLKDQLDAEPGIDFLVFNGGTTWSLEGIALTANSSLLYGTPYADTLTATSGAQTLIGNGGGDTFVGGSGTVSMVGNTYGGDNTFIAGTGAATAYGGAGNDTYSYASGDGVLVINEGGGQNTLALAAGLTAGSLTFTASGHDLLITDGVSGDTITLKNQLANVEGVQRIEFSDLSTESLEGLAITMAGGATSLYGTTGNDTLTATSGTETINGNGGNDIFIDAGGTLTAIGGIGNDTYSYASGSGHLVIQDSAGTNTIKLGSGITTGNVTLTGSGHDLLITDGTGGDQIDITNQLSADLGITDLVFNGGTTWTLEGLALTASSSLLYGTAGNDTLTATSGTETINGNGGNDIFVAAGGALTAIGGAGNDTYSFGSGNGLLTIQDNAGTDTIKLGSGITTGNVSLTASGHDLLITDSVSGDTLTLKNQLSTDSGISYLVFNGGTTENLEGIALTANASILYGTIGNDTLTASSGTQTLTGNGGNDEFVGTGGVLTMNGASGNDLFIGGSGSQVMNGGGGHDVFQGSGGNDTMNGNSGTNSFIASTGTEKMIGGSNGDVFIAGGGTASATGGNGNDLYSFASGGGALIISDASGTDTLKLGTGLTSANVILSESTNGHDLLITDGTGGDLVTVVSGISISSARIETLIYGDASSISLTGGLTLTAQTGSSTLVGLTGNNTLIAVAGGATESLLGNTGNDTYSYSSGDAAVYISEGGNGGTDTLKMGSGLTAANVSLSETNGLDLLIADGTGGDLITIKDQYTSGYSIETLKYGDGSTISLVSGVKISATSGTATVLGSTGNDTLTATTGTQILNGNGGSDTFIGGTGTQTLNGGGGTDGNNVFIAGTGATSAKGASGNDTYSYASGDGALVISETGGTDTLKLATGLTAANVVFSESTNGHDLLITDGTGGDLITMVSDVSVSSSRIEKLIYGDGSTLDLTSGLTLTAQTGSSTLVAIGGNNTLLAVSGANTETLEGNTGNDLYSYASGTGKVYIFDQGGTDTLKFGTGLTAANVVYTESSNGADLLITDGVVGDTITLHNEVRATGNQIENFVYGDGSTANLSSIVLTAGAGNTTLNGTSGNNILVGTTGNQVINGLGGSDVFNGGTGTQTLNATTSPVGNNIFFAGVGTTSARGNTGNDTYNYASGDGALIISEPGGTDTLILGSGLTAANVVLSESTNGRDLLITDGTGGDLITAVSHFVASSDNIESLVYGDGTSISLTGGLTLVAQTGSSTLVSFAGTNTFIAVAGGSTESFLGNTGNDTYSYTAGDGAVYISEGNHSGTDTLLLASGLTSSNVSLSETTNGHDLLITDGTGGDTIDIFDQISGGTNWQVEKMVYGDGTSLSLTGGLTLYAQTGSSTLAGLVGTNTFIAVTGGATETLLGNTGNDTYSYTAGFGAVFISEAGLGGTDTLKLANSMTASNVFFSEASNGADLIITDTTSGDQVTIKNGVNNSSYKVETLVYSDGSTLDLTKIIGASSVATTLNGTTGNDIMIPNTGNLTLAGKGGNDLYDFGRGMGKDVINNGVSTTNTANGTLFFGHGIGDNQLWFDEVNSGGTISPTGANLRIDIMGTTTSMTINGFFTGGSSTYDQLSEFELSDNGLKLDSQLANLVSAMATFETNYAAGHGGTAFDPTAVSSISDTTVLAAVSSDWH